ncbi:MAG: hypothetical protein H6672_00005 [Anaerolineaceae bacterium]|nr:hypothetical protein [Anaerolineaceae bacterium]
MMNTLEREVIEKFYQLDRDAQRRVRELLVQEADSETQVATSAFDYTAWWAEVEALQAEIRSRIGDTGTVGALSLLDELREEAS